MDWHQVRRALLGMMVLCGSAGAADWPQWRGPNLNGSTQATGLPDALDPAKTLVWQTPLAGDAASSPVVAGGKVFVTTLDSNRKLIGLCLDENSGKILWQKEIGTGFDANERNNLASPSPVTDGKNVWFYFGTGDLAAFSADGTPLWARNIQKDYGEFHVQWLYASSPLLFDGKLYVQVLHRSEDSYLLALDPMTGKELWKQVRPNDAIEESKESYATPIPVTDGQKSEVLLVGGDTVTAHDSQTGKELWRCGGYNTRKNQSWRTIASVVPIDGLVIACAPKSGPITAIRDGGSGDVTDTNVAWRTRLTSDVCVPLAYNGNLYVLNGDRKRIVCLEPASGKEKWSGDLGGDAVFRASPTGADGKIYCINERGETWVLAADHFQILSNTSLGGAPCRATIAVADGKVFVRTSEKVYAFAKK
jgi:outer membrane protein assembly factor BamB